MQSLFSRGVEENRQNHSKDGRVGTPAGPPHANADPDMDQIGAGLGYNSAHIRLLENPMSAHNEQTPVDPAEAVVKHIPVVIPVVGGLLIFLLAFIAVFMA